MIGKYKSMMNSLINNDFIPFEDFELKWRFTEERYNLLPEEDLSLIHSLSKIKADYFNKYSHKYLGNACLLKSEFSKIESLKISDDHEVARAWLRAKQIDPGTEVLVSWDNSSCVVTEWQVFCNYWDDFCYPGSDVILVWSIAEHWFVYYCHHDIFEFGTRKT